MGFDLPTRQKLLRQCPELDPEVVVFRLCWNLVGPVAEFLAKNRIACGGYGADVGAREIADRVQGAIFSTVGAEAACAYLSCGGGGDAVEYMANIVVARRSNVRDASWGPVVENRVCAEAFHQVEVVGGAGNDDLKARAFRVRILISS